MNPNPTLTTYANILWLISSFLVLNPHRFLIRAGNEPCWSEFTELFSKLLICVFFKKKKKKAQRNFQKWKNIEKLPN